MDDKLRPVLEALRDAARWMRVEVTNEHEAHAAACKQRVAWLDLEGCCARLLAAALASDAGTRMEPMTGKPPCAAPAGERDAELDRLLAEYHALAGRPKPDALERARAAIHAHVEKVKREAAGEVVASGYLHKNADEKFARVFSETGEELGVAAGWLPVDLVRRRREKEEG